MERKKAADFPHEVIELFNLYMHGEIDRSAFLQRSRRFATGGMTAAAMFALLKPNFAWAQQVAPDDKRIRTDSATVPSPQGNGAVKGYLARPATVAGKLSAVLVVHENRGLNPYIEDVARRLATVGYLAFAPDALTSLGGYPGEETKATQLFASLDRGKMSEDFYAAAQWLKGRPEVTGKLGVVGFCYGGGVANMLATRMPDLAAAVAFYGAAPPDADLPKIKAAVQEHVPELDPNLYAKWPAFDAALTAAKVVHTGYVYPKAYHGFHNDTTPRYDEAAAKLAWQRTLDWFATYLKPAV